ncbi:MAG: type IV secretory system conjugative DNA transfer family protein [Acidimicrobiales bacterium]
MARHDEAQQQPEEESALAGAILGVLPYLAAAAGILALLPVIVVAGLVAVVPRVARIRWWMTGIAGAVGAAVVAIVPGWPPAGHDYELAWQHLIHSHGAAWAGPLGLSMVAAAPVGLLVGAGGSVWWERKSPAPSGGGLSRLFGRGKGGKPFTGGGLHPDTPVAARKELARLRVRSEPGDRLVLGRAGHALVAAERHRHTLVLAPSRAGKGRGVMIPAVLGWSGPVAHTSSKPDALWDAEHRMGALAHRERLGEVAIFDPAGTSGHPCVPWSPLGRAVTWQGALRTSRSLITAAGRGGASRSRGDGNSSFFSARSESVLAVYLRAAAESERDMGWVLGLVRKGLRPEVGKELRAILESAEPEAREAVEAVASGGKNSSQDVMSTVLTLLRPWEDPAVCAATAVPEWDPAELLEAGEGKANSLFVVYGPDANRLSALYATLLDEVVSAAQRRYHAAGRPLDPPLLLALDEVAQAPLDGLQRLPAEGGGEGIVIATAWQSYGQIGSTYGTEATSTILANSAAPIVFPTDDPESGEYVSKLLGSVEITQTSTSKPKRGEESTTTSLGSRTAVDPGALRTMADPLLLYTGIKPIPIKMRNYDQDRHLKARATLGRTDAPTAPSAAHDAHPDSPAAPPPPEPVEPTLAEELDALIAGQGIPLGVDDPTDEPDLSAV